MKLNLLIIKDYSKTKFTKSSVKSNALKTALDRVSVYEKGESISESALTVINSEDFCTLTRENEGHSFICIGDAPLPAWPCDVLFCDGKENMSKVFSDVQDIFLFFNDWEVEMLYMLSNRVRLKEIAEHCLKLLDNPLCIVSGNLRMLAYAEEKGRESFFGNDTLAGAFLGEDEISVFRNDPSFLQGLYSRQPMVLSNEKLRCSYFYSNIFLSSSFAGRIVVFDTVRKIRESDYPIISFISSMLSIAVQYESESWSSHSTVVEAVIGQLLSHDSISAADLEMTLALVDWDAQDQYICCILESEADRKSHTLPSLCNLLEGIVSQSFSIVWRSRVVLIVNLEKSNQSKEQIRQVLSDFAKDKVVKLGISNPFSGFEYLRLFYLQCNDTLGIGQEQDPEKWCYEYEDYALAALIRNMSQIKNPVMLCPRRLQRLIDYDQKHGRNYTEVLKIYLENHLSVAKTTKALFMHRATLLYQLERIKEISDLDLADYDTQLYLMIYFKAIDLTS